MKGFRDFTFTLSIVLAVMAFACISAFADGSHSDPQTTAEQAGGANDEGAMKNFVTHAKEHLDEAVKGGHGAVSVFFREMRLEGTWKHDSVYLIIVNRTGRVQNHGAYTQSLHGDSIGEIPVVKNLLEEIALNDQGGPVCEQYGPDGNKKWTCAVEYQTVGRQTGILIGGLDHDENHTDITPLACPNYEPEIKAEDVNQSQNQEDLKKFVGELIKRIKQLEAQRSATAREGILKAACFGKEGVWKSGPIYTFIMARLTSTGAPVVILNGNNPELTGSPFVNVLDEDGVNVGAEILEVAGANGKGGIVRYKWDNPVIDGDEVSESGKSPGNSPKITYVEAVAFPTESQPDRIFIFGSGIYPEAEDDDGCAIAGTNSNLAGTVFNLFLIMFSLCVAFRWKGGSRR